MILFKHVSMLALVQHTMLGISKIYREMYQPGCILLQHVVVEALI